MPYEIVRNHPQCPMAKPYGVVKAGGDTKPAMTMPASCHEIRAQATAAMVSMMRSEQTGSKK